MKHARLQILRLKLYHVSSLIIKNNTNIKNKKNNGKYKNMCKLKNMVLSDQLVMEEIKREIKNLEKNEKENATCQIL
jgi:hypothetical protein